MTKTKPIDTQAILNFSADTDSPLRESRQEAATFLKRGDAVVPILQGMKPDDQTKFLDRVHDVCE